MRRLLMTEETVHEAAGGGGGCGGGLVGSEVGGREVKAEEVRDWSRDRRKIEIKGGKFDGGREKVPGERKAAEGGKVAEGER